MTQENLAKSTVFYTMALAIQKVLSFGYIVFLARSIGVENMGRLSFALSFTTIFAILLDFGVTQILIKESARDKANSQKYLANTIGFKVIVSVLVYGLVAILINLMGYPSLVRQMVYLAGVVMILDSFTLSFYGIFRGHHTLKFESLGTVINQFLVIAVGVLVIKYNLGMVALVGAYLVGAFFNFLFASGFMRRQLGVLSSISFDWPFIKKLIGYALPFAIAGIFGRIYSNIDMVFLSKLTSDYEVGLYSVAYKVSFAVQFIGLASLASTYPTFCYYFTHSQEMLGKLFIRSLQYLTILSVPLAIGVITIADKIIGPVFGGEYEPSTLALQIMMVAIPLSFATFPLGAMLNACNKQTVNTVLLGATALASVMFNLALIPLWGHVGSAVAVPLSYLVLLVGSLVVVNKTIPYDKKFMIVNFSRILLSGVVMGLVIMYLKEKFHFIVPIIVGGLVYVAVLYLLKGFTKGDIKQMRELLFKKSYLKKIKSRAPRGGEGGRNLGALVDYKFQHLLVKQY